MDKVDFIRIKEDFCSVKTAIKRIKRCHRLGECICKKKTFDEGLVSKMYEGVQRNETGGRASALRLCDKAPQTCCWKKRNLFIRSPGGPAPESGPLGPKREAGRAPSQDPVPASAPRGLLSVQRPLSASLV